MSRKLRFGIVGIGSMGENYAQAVNELDRAELVGVCRTNPQRVEAAAKKFDCLSFTDYKELVDSSKIDVCLIATPHYGHAPISIWAFEHGVHVLTDKPLCVDVMDGQAMLEAHQSADGLKFDVILQSRKSPLWQKMKELVDSDETGRINRVTWMHTGRHRKQTYYDLSGWRGTWHGEGGGLLINMFQHQLDLLVWIFGMPTAVHAHCSFGRYHDIETEDGVTAVLEYPDGKVATFMASTGEFPGTALFDISCDRGRITLQSGKIIFDKMSISNREFTCGPQEVADRMKVEKKEIPVEGIDGGYKELIDNFIDTILDDAPVTVSPQEALNDVMLANAIIYSGYTHKWVELPLDAKVYRQFLDQRKEQHQPA